MNNISHKNKMEPIQKVRQISLKEARKIDANNVDFFTLTDGTIVRIKGEGETSYEPGVQIKRGEPILTQINEINGEEGINNQNKNQIQTAKEEINQLNQQNQNILTSQYQLKVQTKKQQMSNRREKENNFQVNTNLTSGNEGLVQNEEEILQPGDNYGYYISNNGGNIIKTQKNQKCTCTHPLPQSSFYYNAHLIDAEILENQFVNELELKNLSQSETQIFQQGPTKRKKLFKLIEAVPIIFTDIGKQYMNQNINTQINLEQSNNNTFVVENYRLQNMKQNMGINYQNQLYQHNYGSKIPRSKTYLNKIRNTNNRQRFINQEYKGARNWQYNNRFAYNKYRCTCPKGN